MGPGRLGGGPFQLSETKLEDGTPVVLGQGAAGEKVGILQRYGYLYLRTAGVTDPHAIATGVLSGYRVAFFVGTLLVGAAVLVGVAVISDWGWPLLGDYRAGTIALAVIGFAMCGLRDAAQMKTWSETIAKNRALEPYSGAVHDRLALLRDEENYLRATGGRR